MAAVLLVATWVLTGSGGERKLGVVVVNQQGGSGWSLVGDAVWGAGKGPGLL